MWTFFIRECIGAAVLAVATGAVFALGELLRRTGVLSPEQSRKMLHIGGCVTALLFPVLFHSHWSVLVICGGFFLLILWLGCRGQLHAVNDVKRRSYGGVLHPVALYVCYLLATFYDCFAFSRLPCSRSPIPRRRSSANGTDGSATASTERTTAR